MYLMGSRLPHAEGGILEEGICPGMPKTLPYLCCAEMTEQIEMPFGLWTRVGPRKRVLGGMHSGATCGDLNPFQIELQIF